MSGASIVPRLPPELLLFVFDSLRPYDLAQVCKANSHLRKLARPLFYRYATMTKYGMSFPGARYPHPFLDLPGSVKGLSDKKLRRIASRIKEVHIPAHTASDCAAFCNLRLKEVKCRVPTLRIDAGLRVLRTTCSTDWTETFTHIEILSATEENEQSNPGHCEGCDCECHDNDHSCYFIRTIASNIKFEKIVIRNAPMGEDCLVDFSNPHHRVVKAKEFITVLDSRDIWENDDCEFKCSGFNGVTAGLNPLWETNVITIVLWTGQRGTPWMPPCQSGDHLAEPQLADVPTVRENGGLHRQCFFMEDLWADVGGKIGSKQTRDACHLLRIVNATAILETFVDATGDYVEKRPASTSVIEQAIRTAAERRTRTHVYQWKGKIDFLSMEEWIALGEWEDVFTFKEMTPFLTPTAMLLSKSV